LKARHVTAIELLLSYPDSVVAEMLGIRLGTLTQWMRNDEFAKALNDREREQREGLARIARQAAIRAATMLCQVAQDQTKPDAKALLEIIKASGAFEEEEIDPGEALAEAIRMSTMGTEAARDDQSE
jgi:hypothetical protein